MNRAIYSHKSPRTLLFLFILFLGNISWAQYHPFQVENGIWINQERRAISNPSGIPTFVTEWVDKYCGTGNDTIIGNETYEVINFCTPTNSVYHGGIRYETGKVYFVPQDSVSESLLYDFTLNPGDTATVLIQANTGEYPHYLMTTTVISEVDTIIVNGTERRRLTTDYYKWIEGIGCTSGLFMEPWINISSYSRDLVCMSLSDTVHFDVFPQQVGIAGTCNLSLGLKDLEESAKSLQVEIFPNPTEGTVFLKIQEDREAINVHLFNSYGQQISQNFFQHTNELKFEINEPAGIYIIKITTELDEESIVRITKQ